MNTIVQLLPRRRPARRAALAALLALAAAPAAASAEPGPVMTEPLPQRLAAISCLGDPATSAATPVLLVHGTGVTSQENWPSNHQPVLLRRGHAVCTVTMPGFGYVDVQRSAEYVATAIREVHRRAGGRRLSIIGQSQGAFQPVFALRIWPDLAAMVDDLVGLVGAYDRGSTAITAECARPEGCVPAFHQIATGSELLTALARRALPPGPSYTAIGTLADATVTPQPAANEQPGMTSVQIQDLCPGRRMPTGQDHILMAGDAAAFALTTDALGHPGPAVVARADRSACGKLFFDGVDLAAFALVAPAILTRSGTPTREIPPLRCFLRPDCADLDGRGRVLTGATARRTRDRVTVTLAAQAPGEIRVQAGARRVVRRVVPGTRRLTLTVGRAVTRLRIDARPDGYLPWVRERTLRLTSGRPS